MVLTARVRYQDGAQIMENHDSGITCTLNYDNLIHNTAQRYWDMVLKTFDNRFRQYTMTLSSCISSYNRTDEMRIFYEIFHCNSNPNKVFQKLYRCVTRAVVLVLDTRTSTSTGLGTCISRHIHKCPIWPISFVMIERINILCLIIIIKSEVWTITHCLGLGHETMVCAVCLSIFLWEWKSMYL